MVHSPDESYLELEVDDEQQEFLDLTVKFLKLA